MKQSKYTRMRVSLKNETYLALEYFAALNKEPVAVLMRRWLAEEMGMVTSAVEPDVLALNVRRAIRDTLKPVEEALAKHAADAAITAATGMFLGVQCAHDLGVADAVELHDRARRMAAGHVGRPRGATEE